MEDISYVVVFPNVFSKNKIPQLIINIKKILKIQNHKYQSVKQDGDVILIVANDPVFSSSAINLLFGIEKIAIARQVKNDFHKIVSEITTVSGNLLLKGEKFLIKVEGTSKGFFTKDIEIAATSSIIEKKANMGARPGTEENFDKLLYTYLTKKFGYVCIFLDKGQGGIPYESQNNNAICSVYDEISAIACFETIKQGFNSKIIICYRQKSELIYLVKMINQIIPRLVKQEIILEFYNLKINHIGIKNYLIFVNSVLEIMLHEAKLNNINHVTLALSPLIFSTNFIDYSLKRVFQKNRLPIIPLSGVDTNLFEEAKEIGIEKRISKLEKLFLIKSNQIHNFSINHVNCAIKSKKSITVKIGPNNVHDILDSLE
ncbi:MAG: thiamine biosynthesis protein [Nitrosarchaeum sp.]